MKIEDLENKDEIIEGIQSICKANKDNKYCTVHWLKDMIDEQFKLHGYDWETTRDYRMGR